ncbi:MAG: tyrosinase family protein [Acidobacteriota bacterium]|nr:tyrosinase family protein [Acidobacteriota bacterium]
MSKATLTRRKFLSRTAMAAGAVIAGPSLFDMDELFAQATWVRPDVATAQASILNSYRIGIAAMQALPATNPRSWAYQAAIHGTVTTPVQPAWNTCQHGNFFFFSWHRMYIYWFEQIVRTMSGDCGWALPYWNYKPLPAGNNQADAIASRRILPAPFRTPANAATNKLFIPNRNAAINAGTGWLSATICDPANALSQTAFTGPAVNFGGNNPGSGQLEIRPHNNVHVAVGGWMGNPNTAAQDPIFWLHHANIDRYWNVWLKQGGGRANPVNNATWRNRVFTFFRGDGSQVTMTACDILNASAQLKYTYQGEVLPQVVSSCPIPPIVLPPPVALVRRAIAIPIPEPEMIVSDATPVTRTMDLKAVPAAVVKQARSAISARQQNIVLTFGTVEADVPPGVIFEVWVGMEGNPDEKTPKVHHIGDIALFAQGVHSTAHNDEDSHKASFSFILDPAIGPALARNVDKIRITVVPRDPVETGDGPRRLKKPEAALRITDISVSVEDLGN